MKKSKFLYYRHMDEQDGYVPKAKNERNFCWPENFPYSITPLILAVIHRDGETIADLLSHPTKPADVNLADTRGMTPLMHAVKTNDVRIVLRLFAKDGGLPTDEVTKEMLPLAEIIRKGSLVTSGVNVGAQGGNSIDSGCLSGLPLKQVYTYASSKFDFRAVFWAIFLAEKSLLNCHPARPAWRRAAWAAPSSPRRRPGPR